ncbi:hypothetical protein CCZ01_06320 [Helicobacter monodelphidis]|uniref:hypothetical protein n=1 Tax=Helicobacter sp. 15-1451 TaxID=2004995 RepID=UPI000DCE4BA1|nr:hypothetical protein [Helicobacter sp. 15-1451]RAX57311.1 hypothetical protein CCZ01_06320 [Helicobacter sp. 15-1451]
MALSFDNTENRLFHILKITDTNTAMPLLLALKYTLKDKKKLNSCFKVLEIFIITRYVCNMNNKDYNKNFATISVEFCKSKDTKVLKSLSFPKQEQIEESLKYIPSNKNKKANLILFWIELYRRYSNKNNQDIIELSYNYTLEHLCPQSWKQWSMLLKMMMKQMSLFIK